MVKYWTEKVWNEEKGTIRVSHSFGYQHCSRNPVTRWPWAVLYHKIDETELGVRSKIKQFSFTGTHSLL